MIRNVAALLVIWTYVAIGIGYAEQEPEALDGHQTGGVIITDIAFWPCFLGSRLSNW